MSETVAVVRDVLDVSPDGPDGDDAALSVAFEARLPLGNAVSFAPRCAPGLPLRAGNPRGRAAQGVAPALDLFSRLRGRQAFEFEALSPLGPLDFGLLHPDGECPGDSINAAVG